MFYLHEIMMSDALLCQKKKRNTFISLSGLVCFRRIFFLYSFWQRHGGGGGGGNGGGADIENYSGSCWDFQICVD